MLAGVYRARKMRSMRDDRWEVTMFKLCVYYHGVLRYTIVSNMEKAQALRDGGFYVVVKPAD